MLPWRELLGQGADFPVEERLPSLEAVVVPSLEVGGVCRPRYHAMEGRSAFEEIGRSTL